MNRLRELRERAGLSQGELAELVGVTQQGISYLETGDRGGRMGTWRKVCDVLDIDMSDLFPKLWKKP